MKLANKLKILVMSVGFATLFVGCGNSADPSQPLVTDVSQSAVKRQSIGNCWLYATASWTESLHLTATGDEVNASESYWTWWHFYDQVVGSSIRTIDTGGFFETSGQIILDHGVVTEGDFIAGEANKEMSAAQLAAEEGLNEALKKDGALGKLADRTPTKVRAVLDKLFGSDMAAAEKKAIAADKFEAGIKKGAKTTLADQLQGATAWQTVSFPALYGKNTVETASVKNARRELMHRVLKALNDRQPVIMSMMVDFNALDNADGTFKTETLAAAGKPGRQGGHMVVLEDYVVDNVPGVGTIGEGDVADELKEKALEGDIRYFKIKNSWGTNRPERGITDGYMRFNWDYLTSQLAWKADGEAENSPVSYYTTLTDFVLPAGY